MNFLIRPATRKDIPSILAIEEKAAPHPVSRHKIESEFSQEKASIRVAECEKQVVGYVDFWTILPEIEIINIAVDPAFQRQGIATRLFEFLFRSHPDAKKYHLEVRSGNKAAQAFYRKLGFRVAGRRKRYYADGEDAILMTKRLSTF